MLKFYFITLLKNWCIIWKYRCYFICRISEIRKELNYLKLLKFQQIWPNLYQLASHLEYTEIMVKYVKRDSSKFEVNVHKRGQLTRAKLKLKTLSPSYRLISKSTGSYISQYSTQMHVSLLPPLQLGRKDFCILTKIWKNCFSKGVFLGVHECFLIKVKK